ncbi:hypothetical protein OBBRIDRAFT_481452 [Obba rivulosa]|uniref:Uncharacterized protein n=1 Tax=Obba rivulosa TaxID=1052685 RepID=A0A8E2DL09_9APHY|nr:hypothetical protein OBBRIDRAFT_481452 [Obba rivulosa]
MSSIRVSAYGRRLANSSRFHIDRRVPRNRYTHAEVGGPSGKPAELTAPSMASTPDIDQRRLSI